MAMTMRTGKGWRLATLACLLGGCGDGLSTTLESTPFDGGAPPATLGTFGQPCDVIGDSQSPFASFSPTGDMVALSVGGPGHVELHATSDGHLITGFDAHFGLVTALAFSPRDNVLATAGTDGTVKLWRDGVLVAQQQVFPRPVGRMVWSHSGASLALVSQAGPLALVRVHEDALAKGWIVDGQFQVDQPFFSPDDTELTANDTSSGSPINRVMQVEDGTQKYDGFPRLSDAYVHAQSSDGSLIMYTDQYFQNVTVVRLGRLLWSRGIFGAALTNAEFTADTKQIAIWGGREPTPVILYDVESGNIVGTLPWAANSARGIRFSPDGRWALVFDSWDAGGAARLVNLGSGNSTALATLPGRSASIGSPVSVSADGLVMASPTWIGSGSFDNALVIWDLSTRERVSQLEWSFSFVYSLPALSSHGDLAYGFEVVSEDPDLAYTSGLRFQSLSDRTLTERWPEWAFTYAVALSPDSLTLAVAYMTEEVEFRIVLIDRTTNLTKADFFIGARPTTNLLFSPDGTQIAVLHADNFSDGSSDRLSKRFEASGKDFSVWNVANGQLLFESGHHPHAASSLAFSPDGTRLVLIGYGGADTAGIDLYDARKWKWLRTLDQTFNPRGSVRFSTDGRHMVVPHADGIHIWRTSDWQRYETFGSHRSGDAVFLPQNQGVLEIGTGIVWCPAPPR